MRPGPPTHFYVSPGGRAGAAGTFDDPWTLAYALSSPTDASGKPLVGPGATVWLRGGSYPVGPEGGFVSELVGSADRPIVVRSLPGEWAVLVDNRAFGRGMHTFQLKGEWTVLRDIEIMNRNPHRKLTGCKVRDHRPTGLRITGAHSQLVNSVLHDVGVGVSFENASQRPR